MEPGCQHIHGIVRPGNACGDGNSGLLSSVHLHVSQLVLFFFAIYNPDKIRNKEILTVAERAFNNKKENLSPPFPTEWQKLF